MLPFRETIYIKDFETAYENLVFVADIGGTNANFGICALVDHKAILVYSLHIKSRNIEDFSDVVEEVYNHIVVMFNLHLKQGCFGVAGVVSENRDKAKPTNLDFLVNVHEIRKKVPLEDLVLINDFLAVGFGLEQIAPEDIKEIYSGDCKP